MRLLAIRSLLRVALISRIWAREPQVRMLQKSRKPQLPQRMSNEAQLEKAKMCCGGNSENESERSKHS
ncbi:hypothetical protein I7I50_00739 [Histoplasma capsulatum G186AR]|uniref:Secreted protein n=1 Tax=Ajellomyces capsulatus TaxID=5037 RepID=A0A8H7YEE9_AJECA|nr:hypothetical protein I7I52_08007 [Histoplasma capsulatum]QSS72787.1 hypothetical protein I7I50_00739 [Histoplasma capsulatum G186AR]